MKESVIIQKLIQVGQMLERGKLEYSGAEADTIYLLDQYLALRQPLVSGALPITIYVHHGDSTHGRDAEGRDYYIKHVSGNDR